MNKNQKWDKALFIDNAEFKIDTYKKGLKVMELLGKLNSTMAQVFRNHKMPSRIFAFIESKYSNKIEGIYTTLFDTVNTGIETNQEQIIGSLVDALFHDKTILDLNYIKELEKKLNYDKQRSKRFELNFGVYENKKLIYKPSQDKDEVESLLKHVIDKTTHDLNIVDILYLHILFEKVHPFVDANGRIGRLILQKSIIKKINFTNVLPISWAFFKKNSDYYAAFDIKDNDDLNNGINKLLDIITHMYNRTKLFLIDLQKFIDQNLPIVLESSRVVNKEIATDILLSLQTGSSYLQNKYKINHRTIVNIFKYLRSNELEFNIKNIRRKKMYWNLGLESLVDKHFSD